MTTSPDYEQVLEGLLARALKNHDAIAASLRTGISGKRLFKAIDDMKAVKAHATDIGCYPAPPPSRAEAL